jgi:hypothetical protein
MDKAAPNVQGFMSAVELHAHWPSFTCRGHCHEQSSFKSADAALPAPVCQSRRRGRKLQARPFHGLLGYAQARIDDRSPTKAQLGRAHAEALHGREEDGEGVG